MIGACDTDSLRRWPLPCWRLHRPWRWRPECRHQPSAHRSFRAQCSCIKSGASTVGTRRRRRTARSKPSFDVHRRAGDRPCCHLGRGYVVGMVVHVDIFSGRDDAVVERLSAPASRSEQTTCGLTPRDRWSRRTRPGRSPRERDAASERAAVVRISLHRSCPGAVDRQARASAC